MCGSLATSVLEGDFRILESHPGAQEACSACGGPLSLAATNDDGAHYSPAPSMEGLAARERRTAQLAARAATIGSVIDSIPPWPTDEWLATKEGQLRVLEEAKLARRAPAPKPAPARPVPPVVKAPSATAASTPDRRRVTPAVGASCLSVVLLWNLAVVGVKWLAATSGQGLDILIAMSGTLMTFGMGFLVIGLLRRRPWAPDWSSTACFATLAECVIQAFMFKSFIPLLGVPMCIGAYLCIDQAHWGARMDKSGSTS